VTAGCRSNDLADENTPDRLPPSETDDNNPPAPDPTTEPGQPEPGSSGDPDDSGGDARPIVDVPKSEFRAVWVATLLNLDFPSRQDLSATSLKREIDAIVARTSELGLNAVIFQVRPAGDAFYESDIWPWSHWLAGAQGRGIPDFDPLEYWIEACHAKGIELHAWLNPYRIIHTGFNSSDPDWLAPGHPVRDYPELAVGWAASNGNKGLFLDPGLPEARRLIIDGVAEIVSKYDVDGIHIDDYFYPGSDFDDAASFAYYGEGMDLADWRRENVNLLIRGIQGIIRMLNDDLGKNVRWGVSPTAIWMNGSNDPLGVPTTRGQESFSALYADTRRWVMEEWVDYICPQIYWYIGFETADFEPVLNWWIDLCKDKNVDLYIGHAAYREAQNDQPPHWNGEIRRQLDMAERSKYVNGSVFFRYAFLKGAVGNTIRDFYMGKDGTAAPAPVITLDSLTIGMPFENVSITATPANAPGYTIAGTSDPNKPLFMNGAEIANRTIEGFFAVYAPLETGENVFTFNQEGQTDVTRVITRKTPDTASGAPAPNPAPTVDPVTTPTYATVTSDTAWVYPGNSTSGGSDWMLVRGQTDRVVAQSSNGYVKLSCGMWISQNQVALSTRQDFALNILRSGVYRTGADYDMLVWKSDTFAAVNAAFDGNTLTVSFGMHSSEPPLVLPVGLTGTIFASVSSGMNGDTPYYAFTLREDAKFEGCYADFEEGEFRLNLKKRKALTQGDQPLAGITIMLDPGHGGDSYGAIGPMGRTLAEKDLNLINSKKLADRLTGLGAEVHLTRTTDADISLQHRVDKCWEAKPDMFISLHVNSVAETTNAANIRGLSVWYRNPGSGELAQTLLETLYYINPGTNRQRNINRSNFFVCRPGWTPSAIIEASFIINMDDFVWLIDPIQQDKMADATVEAILEYFTPQ